MDNTSRTERDQQAAVAGLSTSETAEPQEGWLKRNPVFLLLSLIFLALLISTVGFTLVNPQTVTCGLPVTGDASSPLSDLTRVLPTEAPVATVPLIQSDPSTPSRPTTHTTGSAPVPPVTITSGSATDSDGDNDGSNPNGDDRSKPADKDKSDKDHASVKARGDGNSKDK